MKTEYEIRVLEIEKESIVKKLESLGAIQKGELFIQILIVHLFK